MASRPGEAQSEGAPKTYRPLVKDYATDSGFDLSKVKHEVGAKETTTIAPPSYLQRRIPGLYILHNFKKVTFIKHFIEKFDRFDSSM